MVVDGCGGRDDEATDKIIFKFIRILRNPGNVTKLRRAIQRNDS
jgi:hypothetical protein